MIYLNEYSSPLGIITTADNKEALCGLWFNGQSHFANVLPNDCVYEKTKIFSETKKWLDIYFSGKEPDFTPTLSYGNTPFRKKVCDIMLKIPYGETVTYNDIAKEIAGGSGNMSAQAVGGAVGHNPISIIIPCHRVVGVKGNLTGYGGGLERKVELLKLEGMDMDRFFLPEKREKERG